MDESALDRPLPCIEGFTVSRFARIDGRCRGRDRDECNAPRFKAKQMLGNDVAGAAIVDANEIVVASPRVRRDRSIEQDDGNPGVVERAGDPLVDVVRIARTLKRCNKYSGYAAIDVLAAQLPGALLFRHAGGAAPDERMFTRDWRGHHALTD